MSETDKINFDLLASRMRATASGGVWHGGGRGPVDEAYFNQCRRIHHGTVLIYTRDTGHHTSGWFKNPDYERAWHLSMSAAPGIIWTRDTPDLDNKMRNAWLKAFFREHVDKLWYEPPFSPEGKARNVQHWRVFCDPSWTPIVPRGEVYTKEFTEKGWLSASELGVVSKTEPDGE